MHLKEVPYILSQMADHPHSAIEALQELKASVEKTIDYLGDRNTIQAQAYLEHGFTNMMAAFHFLQIDLEKVVQREKNRGQQEARLKSDRVILVFSDHAELRVKGELRGTIPLYSQEDYQELRQIAHLFQCRIEQADHVQLDLFAALVTSKVS